MKTCFNSSAICTPLASWAMGIGICLNSSATAGQKSEHCPLLESRSCNVLYFLSLLESKGEDNLILAEDPNLFGPDVHQGPAAEDPRLIK